MRDHERWRFEQNATLAAFQRAVESQLAALTDTQQRMFIMMTSQGNHGDHIRHHPPSVSSPMPTNVVCSSTPQRGPVLVSTSAQISSQEICVDGPLKCLHVCPCQCHNVSLTRVTPQLFSPIIGDLYLSLPNRIIWSLCSSLSECNVQTCRRTRLTSAHIKYFLPTWFIDVQMQIRFQKTPIQFILQTPRIIQKDSPIFQHARNMDVDGIRALLVSRCASVNDVDPNGDGILHVSYHVKS